MPTPENTKELASRLQEAADRIKEIRRELERFHEFMTEHKLVHAGDNLAEMAHRFGMSRAQAGQYGGDLTSYLYSMQRGFEQTSAELDAMDRNVGGAQHIAAVVGTRGDLDLPNGVPLQ